MRCLTTWRATGITIYLENDVRLEHARQMAGHESPRTTKLYDRTKDEVTCARGGANPTVTSDSKAALARPLNRQPDSASEITRRQAPVILQRVLVEKSPLVSPLSGLGRNYAKRASPKNFYFSLRFLA